MQAMHRVRERWIGRRTALINQIRGFLLERGITIRVGAEHLRKNLPTILEDANNGLTPCCRQLLQQLREELQQLDLKLDGVTREIGKLSPRR
jgi:transposase